MPRHEIREPARYCKAPEKHKSGGWVSAAVAAEKAGENSARPAELQVVLLDGSKGTDKKKTTVNSPSSLIPADSAETAHFLACHTLPLGLKNDAADEPYEVVSRATFSLVEIGGRHFFVTCAHVFEKFQEMQADHPNAQLVAYTTIPKFTELFDFHLIDAESKVLDVAIFCGEEARVDLPGRYFIPYEGSYLADRAVSELVCIVGYPGENIEVVPGRADLNYMQLIFPASSVSDRQIVLADEEGNRIFRHFIEPETTQIGLGGLSGSAAYILRDSIYRFVGIVKECQERNHTIIISRLGCLTSDGRIDRFQMPF